MSDVASPRQIMEGTVIPIRDYIRANIFAALQAISADRGDSYVALPDIKSYFIYEQPIAYQDPAVIIVGDNVDFKLDRGQNFICAQVTVYVSVLVSDQKQELLVPKAWRYADALHQILDQQQIIPNAKTKLEIKVIKQEFSNNFKKESSSQGPFLKEALLTLQVEHSERR